jgi:polyisoprenoid-binding protein YceI
MKRLFLMGIFTFVSAFPALAQGTTSWEIDPAHSNAQFTVRHLGISNVQGEFTKIAGSIVLNEQDPTKSSVTATVDMASVDTRNGGRDGDLKSANFFDVAKFPEMTFKSKSISRGADGKLQMTGDLSLHGVTKEVTFAIDGPSDAIKDPWGNMRRGASASAKIHRSDFGITKYPSTMVGEDINITLDVEFTKK